METEFSSYFKVKLTANKAAGRLKFWAGQILYVKKDPQGHIRPVNYPTIHLDEDDYEMYVTEADYWRLLQK